MDDDETRRFQFRLEEYKTLRNEIDVKIKESFALLVYSLTAQSAIYGIFIAAIVQRNVNATTWRGLAAALTAAMFFPILGLIKGCEAARVILHIADYLCELEAAIGVDGWERRVRERRRTRRASGDTIPWWVKSSLSEPPYLAIWSCLILLSLFVRIYAKWLAGAPQTCPSAA